MIRKLARDVVHSLTTRFAYALSARGRVGRLVIRAFSGRFEQDTIAARVAAAIELIAAVDVRRYTKVQRLLKSVFVLRLPGRLAQYVHNSRQCQIDDGFVMDPSTTTEEIASVLVHEATHARLQSWGIPYEFSRQRQEHICLNEEAAFVSRLSNSANVLARVERLRSKESEFWDRTEERTLNASKAALQDLGLPRWFVRAILWLGRRAA